MKTKLLIIIFSLYLSACSSLIEKKTASFAQSLSNSMLNFEDPDTVAGAMPTFIILMDTMARSKDASGESKVAAAQIIGAYSGAFVDSPERQSTLSRLAFTYAKEGSCLIDKKWCNLSLLSTKDFDIFAKSLKKEDVSLAYNYAVAWLSYINAHSNDWNAIAGLQHTKTLLEVVLKFEETYEHGSAHIYLGAIAASIPQALGGKPDIARAHFEKAIDLTEGKNLLAKVEYARRYARSTFNKPLHHQLLNQVISADATSPGLTLMNTWAQQQAKALLASENTYFD